jgi:starch synthase
MLLRTQYANTEMSRMKTVFTIHNIKFQGEMDFLLMADMLSVPDVYNTPDAVEMNGCANMMKAGIVYSDKVTTVSPTYASELLYRYYGLGLEGVLRARTVKFSGIVNGIDTEEFDPTTDPALIKNYDVSYMIGKRENKKALREEYGLSIGLYDPLICMVTRLTEQKGLDLVQAVLEELLQENVAFVLLGSGDEKYVNFFNHIAAKYPGKANVWIGYDEARARRLYAGSDFLLMPSQFEPCGLSQLIAQRYGTLPIVRETGGLVDTVEAFNQYTKSGDGFSFSRFNAHDMLTVIRLALSVYKDKPLLRRLKKNAMLKDNSFLASAEQYLQLYTEISGSDS